MFYIIYFIIFLNIFLNTKIILETIYLSFDLFIHNILPSIFLFYMISNFLLHTNVIKKISLVFKPLIHFSNDTSYVLFFINILLGSPGTTALIVNKYNNSNISFSDYKKLLYLCSFFNPLFIISFFGVTYYLLYFISLLISVLIIGKFFKTSSDLPLDLLEKNNKYSFTSLSNSIVDASKILLQVALMNAFFNVFTCSVSFLFNNNPIINTITPFFEISSGTKILLQKGNKVLSFMLLSFQGLSIIFQNISLIKNKDISYVRYILLKLMICVLSSSIFWFLNIIFGK